MTIILGMTIKASLKLSLMYFHKVTWACKTFAFLIQE